MTERVLQTLKRDLFGSVELIERRPPAPGPRTLVVRRDVRRSRWWLRPLAWLLARREARALATLRGSGTPSLLSWSGGVLERSYIEGRPLQAAAPPDLAYFRRARRLVHRLHQAGVVHNDLAKEPNLLVDPQGRPALVDFQVSWISPRRGPLFRLLAREDLRHLLKHKRTYCPQSLRPRERALLAQRAWPSRLWSKSGKPVYLFVTRRLLGWADREGAGDRSQLR